jgi:hypothetical protein
MNMELILSSIVETTFLLSSQPVIKCSFTLVSFTLILSVSIYKYICTIYIHIYIQLKLFITSDELYHNVNHLFFFSFFPLSTHE